jgi:cell fate regulator YaaT (PSP1 superfamily)
MSDNLINQQSEPDEFPVGSIVPLSRIDLSHSDKVGNAAEASIASTLRNRKSHCTACGDTDGGCSSCKSGSTAEEPSDQMPEQSNAQDWFVEVSFKARRKQLYKKSKHGRFALSDTVIVESEHGTDAGTITAVGLIAEIKKTDQEIPLHSVLRIAAKEDFEKIKSNREQEKEIVREVKDKVKSFGLDMKVVDAEWQFDKSRLSIYFSAPHRVDFRELVKDLARTFHTRIELRQIPAREEAKRLGGIGPCGLELCCSSFLNEFDQITLDHAKAQQLPPNMSKLSGMCGRLKCCLLFEIDNYVSALKNYPPLDSYLQLADGRARMIKIDIFSDTVTVISEANGAFLTVTLEELNALRREGKIESPKELATH